MPAGAVTRVSMTLPQYYRGELNVDGTIIHLTRNETVLVATLLVSPPDRVVSYATLVEVIWPDPDTQALTADQVLHVMKVKLMRKGVPIKVSWGRGMYIPERGRGAPPAALPYYMRLAA